jgi:methylenetetrahydrofolate reductase (NADPH)
MKVTDHLARAAEPPISFEIIPPLRGGTVRTLLALIDDLMRFRPPFIDITSHAAEVLYEERAGHPAPGQAQAAGRHVCALVQNSTASTRPARPVHGFTREETEDSLIELNYLGIENLLAIRGDGQPREPAGGRSVNETGLDLVGQIADMNRGRYLEDLLEATPTDFCIGVAAYPEKHVEAPNMDWDIDVLLQKQRAGADYAVTQIFYDNEPYLRFVKTCRDHGVKIPIVPGLKILTRKEQLGVIPKIFGVDVPPALAEEVREGEPDRVVEVGTRWALEQAIHLLEAGVPSLHFYVMQNTRPFVSLMERLAPSI